MIRQRFHGGSFEITLTVLYSTVLTVLYSTVLTVRPFFATFFLKMNYLNITYLAWEHFDIDFFSEKINSLSNKEIFFLMIDVNKQRFLNNNFLENDFAV